MNDVHYAYKGIIPVWAEDTVGQTHSEKEGNDMDAYVRAY